MLIWAALPDAAGLVTNKVVNVGLVMVESVAIEDTVTISRFLPGAGVMPEDPPIGRPVAASIKFVERTVPAFVIACPFASKLLWRNERLSGVRFVLCPIAGSATSRIRSFRKVLM